MSKHKLSYIETNIVMGELYWNEFWQGILLSLIAWAASFFAPITPFIMIVFLLVAIDLFTGIKAAHAENDRLIKAGSPDAVDPKDVVHSKGLRRTVEKMVFYFLAILMSEAMAQTFKFNDYYMPLTFAVSFGIAGIEYKSNLENIQEVTGNRHIWKFVRDHIIKRK